MPWRLGDTVVLREVWRGRVWSARPVRVVEDLEDGQMFYVAAGTRWKGPAEADGSPMRIPRGDWRLVDRPGSDNPILSFAWPGVAHAVLAGWKGSVEFWGWYINLQEPLRRTAIGFDYMDHALDIVVEPDLSSWSWKDEDELAEAVAQRVFTVAEAAGFRAEGKRALDRLMRRAPPFDRPWEDWRPDPSWAEPALPTGWDVVDQSP
ncbi:MAG: DUF402 domain-containing protein [Actinomycetota bacterium]